MITVNEIVFNEDLQRVSLDFSGEDSLHTLVFALVDSSTYMRIHEQHGIADHRMDLALSILEQISEVLKV